MSKPKPKLIQATEGTRQAPVKQVLLEIIQNRTGAVSSDEIYAALTIAWVLPKNLKQNPRQWVAVMLTEMTKLEFIKRTGTHTRKCGDGLTGVASIAMYDIAPDGAAFLAARGGVVPKYKSPQAPLIDEDGSIIPRDGLSAHINGWAVPRCKWRKGKPAAAHMGVRGQA